MNTLYTPFPKRHCPLIVRLDTRTLEEALVHCDGHLCDGGYVPCIVVCHQSLPAEFAAKVLWVLRDLGGQKTRSHFLVVNRRWQDYLPIAKDYKRCRRRLVEHVLQGHFLAKGLHQVPVMAEKETGGISLRAHDQKGCLLMLARRRRRIKRSNRQRLERRLRRNWQRVRHVHEQQAFGFEQLVYALHQPCRRELGRLVRSRVSDFVECVQGLGEASQYLDFPVVSGNVSFYNETKDKGIKPTPSIGGVGLIKDYKKMVTLDLKKLNNIVLVIGKTEGHLDQSIFNRDILNQKNYF